MWILSCPRRCKRNLLVDGPDFDAHEIDFDEAIMRNKMYLEEEQASREQTYNLFKGVTMNSKNEMRLWI